MVDWSLYDPLVRYFHILAGITWIGLLYFFNLVNLPLLKFNMKKPFEADMAEKATANITVKALWWFRYGALFTVLFGLILIHSQASLHGVTSADYMGYFFDRGFAGYSIFLGALFGIIMAINVWFIIWPNQQVILGNNKKIAAGVGDEEKGKLQAQNAPLLKNAVLASRTNTWLSIPMLFGMVFGAHGHAWSTSGDSLMASFSGASTPVAILLIVLIIMVYMSRKK